MAKRNNDAHDIAGLLFWVTEQARMGCDRAAEENDMTGAQVRALLSLDEPSPMSSLAGHMGCDASNVTGIADRLEARGLIRRETGTDRRIKLLALTPDGEKVRAQGTDHPLTTAGQSPPGRLLLREQRPTRAIKFAAQLGSMQREADRRSGKD
jgi:DNA-binding MarR family transcriptional regulator